MGTGPFPTLVAFDNAVVPFAIEPQDVHHRYRSGVSEEKRSLDAGANGESRPNIAESRELLIQLDEVLGRFNRYDEAAES